MSITGNSYHEWVNSIGAMEQANYWKSLEGPSRWWTLVGVVSFPLVAASSLTQGALLSLGLCTLVTSGTIFTPVQIDLPMAMYLLSDCFEAPRLKVVDLSAVSYAFQIFVHPIWFQIISENYRTAAVIVAVSKDCSLYCIMRADDPYGHSAPAAFVGDWLGRSVQANAIDRNFVRCPGKTVDGTDYDNQNGTFSFRISATDPRGITSVAQFTSVRIERHGSEMSCITNSHRKDPSQRFQFVGGIFPGVRSWRLSSAEAIAEIERGQQFYVEQPAGDRARFVLAMSREKHQYLKTEADGDLLNNLSLLTSMPTIDDGHVRLEV